MTIKILHGSDGKWHLSENGVALDWPPLETKAEAEADAAGFEKELRQLAADEASEARYFAGPALYAEARFAENYGDDRDGSDD